MSAPLPRMHAIIDGRLDAFTLEALHAIAAEAPGRATLRLEAGPFKPVPVQAPPPPPPAPPPPSRPVFGMAELVQAVAFETGVPAARIRGDGRCRADVRARTAASWGAVELLGLSAAATGRALGDRDHSTILTALKRAARWLERDPAFRLLTTRLRQTMAEAQS